MSKQGSRPARGVKKGATMSKLFIIDSDKTVTSSYADFFVSRGYVVASSNTPFGVSTGLKLLLPDVVIAELNFSGLKGLLNIIENTGNCKVVLISADSQEEELKALAEKGQIDDYFLKGEPLLKLASKVSRLINAEKTGKAIES